MLWERFGFRQCVTTIAITTLVAASVIATQTLSDAPDLVMYARIRDEGNTRSHVMNYASELMDGIGPRLTGSPNLETAIAWAMNRLAAAGSSNVRKESWESGSRADLSAMDIAASGSRRDTGDDASQLPR
jgi:hypothetical protein